MNPQFRPFIVGPLAAGQRCFPWRARGRVTRRMAPPNERLHP